MFQLLNNELISINRNCLTGIAIAVALYSYASKYENDSKKAALVKDIAIVLMLYTIICVLAFNGTHIMGKNTNLLYLLYSVFTIIVLSSVIFMIFMNLN